MTTSGCPSIAGVCTIAHFYYLQSFHFCRTESFRLDVIRFVFICTRVFFGITVGRTKRLSTPTLKPPTQRQLFLTVRTPFL